MAAEVGLRWTRPADCAVVLSFAQAPKTVSGFHVFAVVGALAPSAGGVIPCSAICRILRMEVRFWGTTRDALRWHHCHLTPSHSSRRPCRCGTVRWGMLPIGHGLWGACLCCTGTAPIVLGTKLVVYCHGVVRLCCLHLYVYVCVRLYFLFCLHFYFYFYCAGAVLHNSCGIALARHWYCIGY